MLFQRLFDFLRGLVQVQVHGDVQLVCQHAHAFEVGIVDGIRRMRGERGRDQRIVAPLVVDLVGLVEVLVVRRRPRGGEVDHRQAHARTEAVALVGGRLHVGEEVILVDAGGAATEHLGDRQGDAVGDEVRADHGRFDRPDVLLQPDLQRQVVGDAAQQRHRIVRMRVHQARDQRRIRARHRLARREARARLRHRQDRHDAAAGHGDRMVFQHHPVRDDRHHETGFDQQVAGFGDAVAHGASAQNPSV